jgi:3-oxoacyl-[acyl-carrier protein] reductase
VDLGLSGDVALVTGAAGRLGRAICAALGREGAQVAVVDRRGDAAMEVARSLQAAGCKAKPVEADISHSAAVQAMLDQVTQALGPVDVLVNAHGIYPNVPVLEMSPEEWDAVYATNTRGTMLTCQAVGKQLVGRGAAGAIVNLSSAAADSARAGGAAYCGSKAAVNPLTHVPHSRGLR